MSRPESRVSQRTVKSSQKKQDSKTDTKRHQVSSLNYAEHPPILPPPLYQDLTIIGGVPLPAIAAPGTVT